MEHKALILSLKKLEIKYVKRRQKTKLFLPSMLLCILTIMMFGIFGGTSVKQVTKSMSYIFNPVNSLYRDTSTAIFTNGVIAKESIDFVIPIKGAKNVENISGTINFEVGNSIMVYACADGLVEEVGSTLDGKKFVKIKHAQNIYSLVEGLSIVGVSKDTIVKKGQDIATAENGKTIKFEIYLNDIKVSKLKINQSKILWQD